MRKLFFLLLLFPSVAFAQKLPDYGFYKTRIANPDSIVEAEIQPINSLPRKRTELTYYWYSANTIHLTQGSYSGKLLNGAYEAYYPDKSLKSQGQFKKGLKDGIWRSWDNKGNMLELYTWKKGVKNGKYQLFDTSGILKESGSYKQNSLIPPDKRTFWKRLNIFRKRKN
jgi:antitoxin component YwqK of YwqJK toxin-antitoxin module